MWLGFCTANRDQLLYLPAILTSQATRRRNGRFPDLTCSRQQRPHQRGIHFDLQGVSIEPHLKPKRPALPTILARIRHWLHIDQCQPADWAEAGTLADHRISIQLDFVEWEK